MQNSNFPRIGQGIGDYQWTDDHIKSIRAGIDLGMNLLDTAENYEDGNSEIIIGKAIKGIRQNVHIASKFSPEHARYKDIIHSAEQSLKRMQTDHIDIYQIHWHNPEISLGETLSAMYKLKDDGKILHIGICNMYLNEIKNVSDLSAVQLEYNLLDRTVEDEIIPYCEENDIMMLAYSPLDRGRVADGKTKIVIDYLACKYNKTPAQIAINWLLRNPCVTIIPKSSKIEHMKQNVESMNFKIDKEDIEQINSTSEIIYVAANQIHVSATGEGNKLVYQTIEQAKENKLNFVPSPCSLAKSMQDKYVKPVRLIIGKDKPYDLVEGRIRYWAWVIAHGYSAEIPSYLRTTVNNRLDRQQD